MKWDGDPYQAIKQTVFDVIRNELIDIEVQQLLGNISAKYNLIVKCYDVEGWLDVSIIKIDGKIQINEKDTSR